MEVNKKPGATKVVSFGSPAILYAKTRNFPSPSHERFGFFGINYIQSSQREIVNFQNVQLCKIWHSSGDFRPRHRRSTDRSIFPRPRRCWAILSVVIPDAREYDLMGKGRRGSSWRDKKKDRC